MPHADLVVAALINQQVVLESRFRVAALYTGREAAVGCFDVAITMVNTDDVNSVFFIISSFQKNICAPIRPRPRALWIHLMPDSESGPWESHPCASAQLFREVSLSCPRRRRLAGCYLAFKARGCRSHKMVMAHGTLGSGGGECIR